MDITDVEVPLTNDEKAKIVSDARFESGIVIILAIVLSAIPIYYYKAPITTSILITALIVIIIITTIYKLSSKAQKKMYKCKEVTGVVESFSCNADKYELNVIFSDSHEIVFFGTYDVKVNQGDEIKIHFHYESYMIEMYVIDSLEILRSENNEIVSHKLI